MCYIYVLQEAVSSALYLFKNNIIILPKKSRKYLEMLKKVWGNS